MPPENGHYLDPEVLQKIGSLSLVAREVVEGLRVGMHRSPLRGFSTEFAHHRQYVQGDELRYLDWRVYGRTERYYVKLFEAETNFDANLLLDASSSMRYGSGRVNKLEYAKYLAASLAYLVLQQHDSAGLAVFDSQLRQYVPPSGKRGVIGLIEHQLRECKPNPKTKVGPMLHEFAARIPRRGFVILFSDLFDDLDGFVQGINHLRFCGHNVVVFHVLDPYELEFPFHGVCRFVGLENEPEITTQPRRIRERYLEEVAKFTGDVRRYCEKNQVDYILANTATPLDVTLSGFLLARKRLAAK